MSKALKLEYPLDFKFRVGTLSNDFIAKDASGRTLFYVREKMFTWRDIIKVYSDESKTDLLYELRSNKLIDFQQTFTITNHRGEIIGKVRRKTLRSFWRSTFNLIDPADRHDLTMREKNGWTNMWDSIFGEIPIIGGLSGYVFNPSYVLNSAEGIPLFEIKKRPSFFSRKFSVYKLNQEVADSERLLVSFMLIVLIERRNG